MLYILNVLILITQQFSEKLLILYTNVGDELVTLTIGEIIAEVDMCSLGTKIKPK